jgi:hypothetical protein
MQADHILREPRHYVQVIVPRDSARTHSKKTDAGD